MCWLAFNQLWNSFARGGQSFQSLSVNKILFLDIHMSSELQSGLVICKNFTHIWSKVRHKYIIKKQQQQQQKKQHTRTHRKRQTNQLSFLGKLT